LWADEVVTAYVNHLRLAQLWPALSSGIDIEPPLFHLITQAFTALLGPTPLALRLPAIIGGWLMCVSLYLFACRWFRPLYAAIATLIPLVAATGPYTYEARSYGIALGLGAVALVCWQSATERRSALSPVLLAFSLAAAIACHYYMVLVLPAIGAGEVVRSFSQRRIDRSVWAALVASVLPLPFHLPLIQAALTFKGGSWSTANVAALPLAYLNFLAPIVLPVALVVTGLALYRRPSPAMPPVVPQTEALPRWEIVVAVVLASSLAGAWIMARLTNGIFAPRYGFCVVLGIAILALPPIRAYDSLRPLAGPLVLFVFIGTFAMRQVMVTHRSFNTPKLLLKAEPSSAIVIENPLDFIELIYNSPPQIAARLYYLPSSEDAIRYTGSDDDDRQLLLLRQWFPIQVEAPDLFLKQHQRILIWRGGREPGWILQKLTDDGARITLVSALSGEWLFVAMPTSVGL
jgi:hypothetical protein